MQPERPVFPANRVRDSVQFPPHPPWRITNFHGLSDQATHRNLQFRSRLASLIHQVTSPIPRSLYSFLFKTCGAFRLRPSNNRSSAIAGLVYYVGAVPLSRMRLMLCGDGERGNASDGYCWLRRKACDHGRGQGSCIEVERSTVGHSTKGLPNSESFSPVHSVQRGKPSIGGRCLRLGLTDGIWGVLLAENEF